MRRILVLAALMLTVAFSAGAQSHSAILTWTASTTPNVTYGVLRSTDNGGTFLVLASGITGTSYADLAVTAGATYEYEVRATASDGTLSDPTTAAVATIPGGTQQSPLTFAPARLSAGTVGTPYTSSVSATGGTPPYQYASQTLPTGLLIGPGTGAITGTPTVAATYQVSFSVTDASTPPLTASASGTILINPATPPATTCKAVYVRAGGPSLKVGSITWSNDTGFSGGTDYLPNSSIKGTSSQYPASLYNSERWGVMQDLLPAQAGCKYTLTIGETESTFTKAGQRVFSVTVNGAGWLNNLDLIASTGGIHVGKTYTTTVTANSSSIVVGFVKGSADMPKVDFLSLVPGN